MSKPADAATRSRAESEKRQSVTVAAPPPPSAPAPSAPGISAAEGGRFVDPSDGSRRRDQADPEPGYGGMNLEPARPPDGYFLGWTPGKRTRRAEAGAAWTLKRGADLVLQLHLTSTGKPERLRPQIGLYFTEDPPTATAYPLCMFADDIDLPAGAADVVVTDQFVTPVAVNVHSIYPHAHYLCRSMSAWATLPNGERRDLFRIDRWDFDWQDDYTFREPMALPAGTRFAFEYHYDNSLGNPSNPSDPPRRVTLGDRSTDEMGNLTLQVMTKDQATRRQLGEAGVRRDLDKLGYNRALLLEQRGAHAYLMFLQFRYTIIYVTIN